MCPASATCMRLRLDRTAMGLKVLNNWGLMFITAGQMTEAETVFART